MDLPFLQFFLPYFNILGVTIGLSSSPAAVYCAEIAVPKLRGRLTVLTSLAIAVGILMIYTLGFFFPVKSSSKMHQHKFSFACIVFTCVCIRRTIGEWLVELRQCFAYLRWVSSISFRSLRCGS